MEKILKKIRKYQHQKFFNWFSGKVINLGNLMLREMVRPEGSRDDIEDSVLLECFPDLIVRNGPFKGMRYPEKQAVGSALFPKLVGSYERELHPIFESAVERDYSAVVDIGCAEGYYAIGMARMLPKVTVYAYDIEPSARALCSRMGELNGVGDRLEIGSFCSPSDLMKLKIAGRALIISDCEGYEKELFSEDLIPEISRHDVLIESHDCVDRTISAVLFDRFCKTHEVNIIQSISDPMRARLYQYELLDKFDFSMRFDLLREKRMETMNWFYMKSRA